MAKNAKKITALGLGPDAFQETRIRPTQEQGYEHTHTHADEHKQEYTQAHTDTHTHEHEPVARIKKDRRVQWLTYDSLIQRIDAYAKERGVSRADVLEAGMEKFLSDLGR